MQSRGTRFFCSAIVMGSAMAIGAAPVDDAQDLNQDSKGENSRATVTPHRHRLASIRRLNFGGTAESDNWAGYAIAAATPPSSPTSPTGVTVTSVTGAWKVPAVTCHDGSTEYSSFWVGIDGWYSNTVEQIGTDSDCSSGTPSYYAWYEFYPLDFYYACPSGKGDSAPPCALMELKPGDVISAAVNCDASRTCTATITDESMSPPASFSTTFVPTEETGTPQLSSGEWIAETACCTNSGGYLRLPDFGTAYYGQDFTWIFGTNFATVITSVALDGLTVPIKLTAPIGAFFLDSPATWWATTMINENYAGSSPPPPADVMAAPSGLSYDGSSFTITWKSAGP